MSSVSRSRINRRRMLQAGALGAGGDDGASGDDHDDARAAGDAAAQTGTDPAGGTSTDADAAAGDAQVASAQPAGTDEAEQTGLAASESYTEATTQGPGTGPLWVTVGILTLLGGGTFLATRRRRHANDFTITHELEP